MKPTGLRGGRCAPWVAAAVQVRPEEREPPPPPPCRAGVEALSPDPWGYTIS